MRHSLIAAGILVAAAAVLAPTCAAYADDDPQIVDESAVTQDWFYPFVLDCSAPDGQQWSQLVVRYERTPDTIVADVQTYTDWAETDRAYMYAAATVDECPPPVEAPVEEVQVDTPIGVPIVEQAAPLTPAKSTTHHHFTDVLNIDPGIR